MLAGKESTAVFQIPIEEAIYVLSQWTFIPLHFLDTEIGDIVPNVHYHWALTIVTTVTKYFTVIWVAQYSTTWERCSLNVGFPEAEPDTKFRTYDLLRHALRRKRMKKAGNGPGWCSSVDCMPTCEPNGHQFDSQSEHIPGLWARSPVGGMREATDPCISCTLIFLSLFFPPFPSVSFLKRRERKERRKW